MRSQKIATALMAYATWLAWQCPCEKTLSCHMKEFFLTVGTAVALIVNENL
jgi:hypothetical protein